MNLDNIKTIIDIGTTKIVVLTGILIEKNLIKILGKGEVPSEGVEEGMVQNILKVAKNIKSAIKLLEEQTGYTISKIDAVGISGKHIRSMRLNTHIIRDIPTDVIREEDIIKLKENILRMNLEVGEEFLSVNPLEYNIDGKKGIKDPVGRQGSHIEVCFHCIIAQINFKNILLRAFKEASLDVEEVILEAIASTYSALEYEEKKEASVVIIDIGGGTTDLSIVQKGNICYTAIIEQGGNNITKDIEASLNISYRKAEEIKIQHGKSIPSINGENFYIKIPGFRDEPDRLVDCNSIAEIISYKLKEILDEVYYHIEKYIKDNEVYSNSGLKIVLTGGGANLKNIDKVVTFSTGLHTVIGNPRNFEADENIFDKKAQEKFSDPMYATAIGLLIYIFKNNISIQKKEQTLPNDKKNNPFLEFLQKKIGNIFNNVDSYENN